MSNAIGGIGSLGLNHLQTLAAHLGAANLAQVPASTTGHWATE